MIWKKPILFSAMVITFSLSATLCHAFCSKCGEVCNCPEANTPSAKSNNASRDKSSDKEDSDESIALEEEFIFNNLLNRTEQCGGSVQECEPPLNNRRTHRYRLRSRTIPISPPPVPHVQDRPACTVLNDKNIYNVLFNAKTTQLKPHEPNDVSSQWFGDWLSQPAPEESLQQTSTLNNYAETRGYEVSPVIEQNTRTIQHQLIDSLTEGTTIIFQIGDQRLFLTYHTPLSDFWLIRRFDVYGVLQNGERYQACLREDQIRNLLSFKRAKYSKASKKNTEPNQEANQ